MTQDILYPEECKCQHTDRLCKSTCHCVYGLGIPDKERNARLVYSNDFIGISFQYCPMCGRKLEAANE